MVYQSFVFPLFWGWILHFFTILSHELFCSFPWWFYVFLVWFFWMKPRNCSTNEVEGIEDNSERGVAGPWRPNVTWAAPPSIPGGQDLRGANVSHHVQEVVAHEDASLQQQESEADAVPDDAGLVAGQLTLFAGLSCRAVSKGIGERILHRDWLLL